MLIRKVDSKHGFIVLTKNKCLTYVAPKYKKRKADGKDGWLCNKQMFSQRQQIQNLCKFF